MTYQDETSQISQLVKRHGGTWDGIDAESVALLTRPRLPRSARRASPT